MKRLSVSVAAALLAVAAFGARVNAQLPVQFDENTYPVNPENTFGAFTHGEFATAGALIDGPTSLILNVTDSNLDGNSFGGVGVDFGPLVGGALVPHDFNPATSVWELRIRKLPLNTATAIRTTYIDLDNFLGTSGDEHVFEFDLTGVPIDGNFHTLLKPASAPLFTQGAFGLIAGNTVNDPGLKQIQVQSLFGTPDILNVEIDYVRIRAIPEPATLALFGLGGLAMMAFRRKRMQ